MRAVENDEDYILRFPCDIPFNVDIKEDYYNYNDLNVFRSSENDDIFYLKKIKAKEYWNEIIKSAHNVAEPGILFWDNTLNNGLDAVYNEYKPNGVNPCGEVTLSESDSCRLMVVNIFTKDAYFNFNKFYKINYEAMRLSDDLVDLELEAVNKIINKIKTDPEPDAIKKVELDLWERVKNVGQSGRRTGLGFTGLGDMLAALGVKYDSDEALLTVEKIMYVKMESELDCTIDMAITRGTFEGWDKDLERVI